jgi:uncharacterized membrane-anchored protein YhcB (DUF1043 family)
MVAWYWILVALVVGHAIGVFASGLLGTGLGHHKALIEELEDVVEKQRDEINFLMSQRPYHRQ